MEIHIVALCGQLFVPAVEYKTVDRWIMNFTLRFKTRYIFCNIEYILFNFRFIKFFWFAFFFED